MNNNNNNNNKQFKVRISVHASKLKNVASGFTTVSAKSSPYAVVTLLSGTHNKRPKILGKTEVIKHCLSPTWIQTFETTYTFGQEIKLNISIFDEVKKKTGECKTMGTATFEMGQILQGGGIKAKKLQKSSTGGGTVFVRVTQASEIDLGTAHIKLRGIHLKNVDAMFFGKSDPFFIIQAQVSKASSSSSSSAVSGHPTNTISSWHPVYRSEVLMDNLNPEWQQASVPMDLLCGGDPNRSIQIEVWDWGKNGNHQPMGKIQTSLNGLIQKAATCTDGDEVHDCDASTAGFQLLQKGKAYGILAVTTAFVDGGGGSEEAAATDTNDIQKTERSILSSSAAETTTNSQNSVRSQKEVQQRFVPILHKEGNIFRKKVSSYIRRAKKGEHIVTAIDGVHESQKVVDDDTSWVVCGKAAGERYVLTDTEFHESYDETTATEIPAAIADPQLKRLRKQGFFEYQSKRYVWAHIVNDEDMKFFLYKNGGGRPDNDDDDDDDDAPKDFAYFVAPWGESMRVEKGDFLVTQYAPNGKCKDEVYRVEQIVFQETYVDTEKEAAAGGAAEATQKDSVQSQKEVQQRFVPILQQERKVFRKKVSSYIRKAKKGEQVITAIDGVQESQKTVNDESSWVVCGKTAGEHYVLTDKEFLESYDEDSATEIPANVQDPQLKRLRKQGFFEYQSKRYVWAHVVNGDDMVFFRKGKKERFPDFAYFVAPWGETMRVEKGDYLVTQYPPNGECKDEVYRVERFVFEDTYADIEKEANAQSPTPAAAAANLPYTTTKPKFIDYILGGAEINLVVAIDFTSSNGDPVEAGTLHHIRRDGGLNDYEKALTAVGSIVARYDSDQMFPVLGFGAKINGAVHNCFRVGKASELKGIKGIMEGYRSLLTSGITMSGPTVFSEVIRFAASQAQKQQDAKSETGKQSYTILLVLTNGASPDVEETKKAICSASAAPMSIVFVGVGDADFSAMRFLDKFQAKEGGKTRDIVKFVQFSKYRTSREALTRETLDEIPDQLVNYFFSKGIMPLAPAEERMEEIPEEECDDDDAGPVYEFNDDGDITISSDTRGSRWDVHSYGNASNFLPVAVSEPVGYTTHTGAPVAVHSTAAPVPPGGPSRYAGGGYAPASYVSGHHANSSYDSTPHGSYVPAGTAQRISGSPAADHQPYPLATSAVAQTSAPGPGYLSEQMPSSQPYGATGSLQAQTPDARLADDSVRSCPPYVASPVNNNNNNAGQTSLYAQSSEEYIAATSTPYVSGNSAPYVSGRTLQSAAGNSYSSASARNVLPYVQAKTSVSGAAAPYVKTSASVPPALASAESGSSAAGGAMPYVAATAPPLETTQSHPTSGPQQSVPTTNSKPSEAKYTSSARDSGSSQGSVPQNLYQAFHVR